MPFEHDQTASTEADRQAGPPLSADRDDLMQLVQLVSLRLYKQLTFSVLLYIGSTPYLCLYIGLYGILYGSVDRAL